MMLILIAWTDKGPKPPGNTQNLQILEIETESLLFFKDLGSLTRFNP
jgi:hypothetical protein